MDHSFKSVDGTKIVIDSGQVYINDFSDLYRMSLESPQYPGGEETAGARACMVSLYSDKNSMDELALPMGKFSIISKVMMLLSLCNLSYSIFVLFRVLGKYIDSGRRGTIFMKLMVLIPEFLGNAFRLIACYDTLR